MIFSADDARIRGGQQRLKTRLRAACLIVDTQPAPPDAVRGIVLIEWIAAGRLDSRYVRACFDEIFCDQRRRHPKSQVSDLDSLQPLPRLCHVNAPPACATPV